MSEKRKRDDMPETDWTTRGLIGLAAFIVFLALVCTGLHQRYLHQRQILMETAPCADFASWPAEDVPLRCTGGLIVHPVTVPVDVLHLRVYAFCRTYGRSSDCERWSDGALWTAGDIAAMCDREYPAEIPFYYCMEENGF